MYLYMHVAYMYMYMYAQLTCSVVAVAGRCGEEEGDVSPANSKVDIS